MEATWACAGRILLSCRFTFGRRYSVFKVGEWIGFIMIRELTTGAASDPWWQHSLSTSLWGCSNCKHDVSTHPPQESLPHLCLSNFWEVLSLGARGPGNQ